MAKFSYGKQGSLRVAFDNFFQRATDLLVRREDTILIQLNERILALTPVWEGDALINWRWSTRAPMSGHIDPIGTPDDPGHTNKMPLGTEPRRAANEVRPRASLLAALRAKEPEDIYLSNNSDHIVDLEYGLLPTPENSRVKAGRGIVRLAIKEVLGSLH
jgi:hypothetical protein